MTRALLFISIITSLWLAASAHSVGESKTQLSDLRILSEQSPPFNYTENGKAAGLLVDRLLDISNTINQPINREKIQVINWARAYKTALSGPNVMLFGTARTPAREELFKWAGPIAQSRMAIWAKKSANIAPITDIQQIQGKISVVRNDVSDQLVAEAGVPENKIMRTSTVEASAKRLAYDTVTFWAYSERSVEDILTNINEDVNDYEIVYILHSSELYFAFSKDVDDRLVQQIQQAIDTSL